MKAWHAIVAGLIVGTAGAMLLPDAWLVSPPRVADGPTGEVWACPMLCVKMDRPGTCPVCGMDLEQLEDSGDAVILDRAQRAMVGLETATAQVRPLEKHIRTVGEIDYDETRVRRISAWVGGRIEQLRAASTWADVKKDDPVLELYSPMLYAAQQELLVGGSTVDDARRKLQLLGMSGAQIEEVERTKKALERVDVLSPLTGKVIRLSVKEGDYVKEGDDLYTVADFSSFWLRFDAYEADLPWLKVGLPVDITLDAAPGRIFEGAVSFIEGVVDRRTRTTKVRVTVKNPDGTLRPGMFANVKVRVDMGAVLSVPRSAVLSTGDRHVVYLRTGPGRFELRSVQVGAKSGDYRQVLGGLDAGDVVATAGNFLIDSQMQLTGRPSLLVPGGGDGGGGHQH